MVVNCDLVVAEEHARFGFPEVTRGVLASQGAIPRLIRIAGHQVGGGGSFSFFRFKCRRAILSLCVILAFELNFDLSSLTQIVVIFFGAVLPVLLAILD